MTKKEMNKKIGNIELEKTHLVWNVDNINKFLSLLACGKGETEDEWNRDELLHHIKVSRVHIEKLMKLFDEVEQNV